MEEEGNGCGGSNAGQLVTGAMAGQCVGEYLSRCLVEVCSEAEGLSGRTLRKLPFLAHAHAELPGGGRCSALQFVGALLGAVRREREDRGALAERAAC